MAIIFRSLRHLARKTPRTTPFFTPSPNPPPSPLPSTSSSSPIFITSSYPFHGPLFLSFPPSKLLQSATPLFYFQSHLLPPKFPINLGLRSYCQVPQPALGLQLLNLPNLISISRLLSGPLLAWMIMNDMYTPAFIGLILSGATDWLDGYVARKMGINSVVGSYLDPLADKVLIGCVAIAMVERGLLHSGLVALVVMRDVALVGGAVYIRANHLGGSKSRRSWSEFFDLDGVSPRKVEPLMISKVNTCFQLALVTGALLQPEFGTPETDLYITYLSWVVATTTMASTAAYGMRYLRTPRS